VLVGVFAVANADEGAAGGFNFLGYRHEIAGAADDDDSADVIEPADVLGGVQAQFDVGAVLGRAPRGKGWMSSTALCSGASRYLPKNCQLQKARLIATGPKEEPSSTRAWTSTNGSCCLKRLSCLA
jgi:hypothetical protein